MARGRYPETEIHRRLMRGESVPAWRPEWQPLPPPEPADELEHEQLEHLRSIMESE